MARAERPTLSESAIASPEQKRPRRVTVASTNNDRDDLFLNLAIDEPNGEPLAAKPKGSHPSRLDSILASARRLANSQVGSRSSLSPADAVKARSRQYDPPRTRPSTSPKESRQQVVPRDIYPKFHAPDDSARTSSTDHNPTSALNNSLPQPSSRHINLVHETPKSIDSIHSHQPARLLDPSPGLRSPTDGAESVGSTTAVSTVWDELEELRLRIRRLEHTGTSARPGAIEADYSADRPHTATTMTTSSSVSHPVRPFASSSYSKSLSSSPISSYPLLESALSRSKEIIDPGIFEALETSVSDAAALAAIAAKLESNQDFGGSSNTLTPESILQKRLRRKADSLCRGLTDLCIALCEESSRQPCSFFPRSVHRDYAPPETEMSNEQSPLAYLDARRVDRSRSVPHRPQKAAIQSVDAASRASNSSLAVRQALSSQNDRDRSRVSILEEREADLAPRSLSRAATNVSQIESEDQDPTIRIPSRAMSEVQHSRLPSSRDLQKFSRDYTAQHPMPERNITSSRHPKANQSDVSLLSARQFASSSTSYPRPESRSGSRFGNRLEPSPTLAERLAHRRQQQQQEQQKQRVATPGYLGSTIGSTARALSGTGRPSSSARRARYGQEDSIGSDGARY